MITVEHENVRVEWQYIIEEMNRLGDVRNVDDFLGKSKTTLNDLAEKGWELISITWAVDFDCHNSEDYIGIAIFRRLVDES